MAGETCIFSEFGASEIFVTRLLSLSVTNCCLYVQSPASVKVFAENLGRSSNEVVLRRPEWM